MRCQIRASLAIIISYPTSVNVINCFINNNQEILLDFTDFALQEQPEDNLMVAISRAWYNGSYTMAAKPIKLLALHLYNDPAFNNLIYLRLWADFLWFIADIHHGHLH